MTSLADFTMQMTPSQLEVIDSDKFQRRGGIIRLTIDAPAAHPSAEPRPPRLEDV